MEDFSSSITTMCFMLFLGMLHILDILLCLMPLDHDLVAAAQAFEPEVCAGAQDLPPLFTAGMGFFHHQDILQSNVHYFLIPSQYCFAACSTLLDPYS